MKAWVPAAALALALSPFLVLRPSPVRGESMAPTFHEGQVAWGLRAWALPAPARGEVWVVLGPAGPSVKRVLGLPGETVELKGPRLTVDGRGIEEPYVRWPEPQDQGPWSCGAGYLVLGDNRPKSHDGRAWGPLPRAAFLARVRPGDSAAQEAERP
ncbi:MAG TPA: signal peptidase I [Holophagaceae bacterium]|nr:signal peptidase I [Holophagaceae bacterium]